MQPPASGWRCAVEAVFSCECRSSLLVWLLKPHTKKIPDRYLGSALSRFLRKLGWLLHPTRPPTASLWCQITSTNGCSHDAPTPSDDHVPRRSSFARRLLGDRRFARPTRLCRQQ